MKFQLWFSSIAVLILLFPVSTLGNDNFGLLNLGGGSVGCEDNGYALVHPEECSVGCEDNGYALVHPEECSVGCEDNGYALVHPEECSVGCEDNGYALVHPEECSVGCEDNGYALVHPEECSVGCEDNGYALVHPEECSVGCEDNGYALVHPEECSVGCEDNGYALVHPEECSVGCEDNGYALVHPEECSVGCEDNGYALVHPEECSVGCEDNGYALVHPEECSVGCEDNGYALVHPEECSVGCEDNGYALVHPEECSVGCEDNGYALVHPEECSVGCEDNGYALVHPEECSVGCEDNGYALVHPEECSVGCEDNGYALVHPEECSVGCEDNGYALVHPEECSVGCEDNGYALVHPEECSVGCEDNGYALVHPEECDGDDPDPPTNSAPVITVFSVPSRAHKGSQISVSVTATDRDSNLARIQVFGSGNSKLGEKSCSGGSCSGSFTVGVPNTPDTPYTFVAKAVDSKGKSDTESRSGRTDGDGTTNSAPVITVFSVPSRAHKGSQISVSVTATDRDSNLARIQVFGSGNSKLGEKSCSGGSCSGSFTVGVPNTPDTPYTFVAKAVDSKGKSDTESRSGRTDGDGTTNSAPVITVFSVPSRAHKGSQISVSVTATDRDSNLARIQVFGSGNSKLGEKSCSGGSCSGSFTVGVPNTPDTPYTFVAKAVDSKGKSDTESRSGRTDGDGTTNSAPVITVFSVPSRAHKGSQISVSVTATDRDSNLARIQVFGSGNSKLGEKSCSGGSCSGSFTVGVPNTPDTPYTFVAKAVDSKGKSDTESRSGRTDGDGTTNSAPVITVFSVPSRAHKGSQISVSVTATDRDSNLARIQVFGSGNSKLGEKSCSGGSCSGSFTVGVPNTPDTPYTFVAKAVDSKGKSDTESRSGRTDGDGTTNSAPVITVFSVPSRAHKGSQISVSVTATDRDSNLARIQVFGSGNSKLGEKSCSGGSCTGSFTVGVPDSYDTAYSFVAKAVDSRGASDTETRSGRTYGYTRTKIPPVTTPSRPFVPPAPVADVPAEPVPSTLGRDVLISALEPAYCASPGAETSIYASLKNRGDTSINDVKIVAVIPELGIRAVSGPFDIRKRGTPSSHLDFEIPSDAEEGEHYVRITISSGQESIVRYRTLYVSSSCPI